MQNTLLLVIAGATAVAGARNGFAGRDLQQYGGYGYGYGYPSQPDVYSPEQPAYSPEVPAYSPSMPAYSPSVPVYSPEVPAYSPEVPAYSPSPVYSPEAGYSPETAYSPVIVYSPEAAYAPSPAYSPVSDIYSPSIVISSPSQAPTPGYGPETTLEDLAQCFDYNDDGALDFTDIKNTVEEQVSSKDIQTFVNFIDMNGDGKVTFSEILLKVQLALFTGKFPPEVVTILNQIDIEQLCGITADEVLQSLSELMSEDPNTILMTLFNVLDIDDNGLVPITSIVDSLKNAGVPTDILNIITAMDANADGEVSESEFSQYITDNNVPQKLVDWYTNNF